MNYIAYVKKVGELNREGNYEYENNGTLYEVDVINMRERHCGVEVGCFWTDWEEL